MLGRVRRLAVILALGAGVAACGGKSKGGTTPGAGAGTGAGGGDAVGMKDGEPVGGDDVAPGTGSEPGTGTGSEPEPGTGTGTGTGTGSEPGTGGEPGTGEPEPPPIVPPNLDPDPQAARAEVEAHLKKGRDALRGATPDPDLALREAKAALAIDGTNVDAVVVMAHAYYQKKLYDTAETILDMLMKDREVAKQNAGVYYVYGLVYDKINELPKARVAYEQAVALEPDHVGALINLGVHQLRNKQYDDAIRTYEKVTGQLGINEAATWNSLGSAYRGKSADYDPGSGPRADWLLRAETAYKRALAVDRNYGPAYYNLGLLYLDADPFPGPEGGDLDTLVRLNKAKTYFEEYKNMPGVDMKLFDERMKNVTKLIKREEKKRKRKEGGSS